MRFEKKNYMNSLGGNFPLVKRKKIWEFSIVTWKWTDSSYVVRLTIETDILLLEIELEQKTCLTIPKL